MDFDFSKIINLLSDTIKNLSSYLYDEHPLLGYVANIVTIATPIIYLIKKVGPKIWKEKESRIFDGIDDKDIINLVTSHKYIQTMGQKEPPHKNETIYISPNRFPLAKHIRNDILNKDEQSGIKRYMILGGSGMGKSTFSVALYYDFIYKYKLHKHYSIYIKSLCDPEIIGTLKDLNSSLKKASIIILDALDENIEAAKDVSAFIDELEKATSKFNFVIITCRTQFFNDESSEPNALSINKKWGLTRKLKYEKYYISPFKEKEAKKYLRRKYGFNIRKYSKAVKIAEKCWDVLSRPMILSFIDDLMEFDNINNLTAAEIYYKIIDKWFDHEKEIQDIDKCELFSFSKKIALLIYIKWRESGLVTLRDDEYHNFLIDNGFAQSPYSFKKRSLVNRSSDGSIKFSHRSFWEFFIAMVSFEEPGRSYVAIGFSMAEKFFSELCSMRLKGKNLEFINYDEDRLSYIKPLLQQKLVLDSTEKEYLLHNRKKNIDNLIIGHRILLKILDASLKLICNVIESNFKLETTKQNADDEKLFVISGMSMTKSGIDMCTRYLVEDQPEKIKISIEDYAQLIARVQTYLEMNDIKMINSYLRNIISTNKSIKELFKNLRLIKLIGGNENDESDETESENRKMYFSFSSGYNLQKTRCPIIGSGFDIFHWIQLINETKDYATSMIVIILKDSDDLNELVDFIYGFKNVDLPFMVCLNIKFKSTESIVINYFIDNNTKCYEEQKIRSILENELKAKACNTNRKHHY